MKTVAERWSEFAASVVPAGAHEIQRLLDTQLRQLCHALGWQGGTYHQVLSEVMRLRQALRWQDERDGRIGTHGPTCHTFGPAHYECALQMIARLRDALARAADEPNIDVARAIADAFVKPNV